MRSRTLCAVAGLGIALALPVDASVVGFSGAWAPNTWTTTIVGTVDGGGAANGSVNTAGAPSSIMLNGGDDPTGSIGCFDGFLACEIQFSHLMLESPVSFHWSYTSNDSAGAQLDSFGVLLNGVHTQLSDPGGLASQQGDAVYSPSTTFGFYINCGDCVGGNAVVTISAFQVPEPASMALVGLGLLGLGALRRKTTA